VPAVVTVTPEERPLAPAHAPTKPGDRASRPLGPELGPPRRSTLDERHTCRSTTASIRTWYSARGGTRYSQYAITAAIYGGMAATLSRAGAERTISCTRPPTLRVTELLQHDPLQRPKWLQHGL
jgi:hypothetical protein